MITAWHRYNIPLYWMWDYSTCTSVVIKDFISFTLPLYTYDVHMILKANMVSELPKDLLWEIIFPIKQFSNEVCLLNRDLVCFHTIFNMYNCTATTGHVDWEIEEEQNWVWCQSQFKILCSQSIFTHPYLSSQFVKISYFFPH